MRGYINSIYDMMNVVYGSPTLSQLQEIFKDDAPVLSTTTGVYNAVYGAQVWAQINQEANIFAALPKYAWKKSGWRVITARAGATADGGVAENNTLRETVKPTFVEVSSKPKHVAHNFDVSLIQQFLAAESEDDAFGSLEQMRVEMAKKHREAINQQLLTDFDTLPTAGAGGRFESIDRVTASDNEETSLSYTAGDADIHGIDRSASAWSDAYVDHASGTDRALTDTMLRTLIQNIGANGGNTTVWNTGWDTYRTILGLFDPQVQYNILGQTPTTVGFEGVNTPNGFPVGLKVSTLYGIPMIISKDVPSDTISRIYGLDTSDPEGYGKPRLGFKTMFPTLYFESPDYFGINKLGKEGMYVTGGELICHFFKAQGKIRDLL